MAAGPCGSGGLLHRHRGDLLTQRRGHHNRHLHGHSHRPGEGGGQRSGSQLSAAVCSCAELKAVVLPRSAGVGYESGVGLLALVPLSDGHDSGNASRGY